MKNREFDADRAASLGDRAVAITVFLAFIATGLFGAEPERDATPAWVMPAPGAPRSSGNGATVSRDLSCPSHVGRPARTHQG